jgi:hypothetical protein
MTKQEKLNIVKHLNSCFNNISLAKKVCNDLNLAAISGYLNTIERDLDLIGAEIRLIES